MDVGRRISVQQCKITLTPKLARNESFGMRKSKIEVWIWIEAIGINASSGCKVARGAKAWPARVAAATRTVSRFKSTDCNTVTKMEGKVGAKFVDLTAILEPLTKLACAIEFRLCVHSSLQVNTTKT